MRVFVIEYITLKNKTIKTEFIKARRSIDAIKTLNLKYPRDYVILKAIKMHQGIEF